MPKTTKDRPWWWNLVHRVHSAAGITRRKLPVIEYGSSFFGRETAGTIKLPNYEYWCKCGQQLEDGPSGGLSVNAVCKKCMINYGCMYGFRGYFGGS